MQYGDTESADFSAEEDTIQKNKTIFNTQLNQYGITMNSNPPSTIT